MSEPGLQTARTSLRTAGSWAAFFLLLLTLPATLLACLLLLDAETWAGRLFALSCISAYASGCCLCWWLRKGGRAKQWLAVLCGLTCVGLAVCYLLAPPGVAPSGSKLQSVFPPGRHYTWWTPPGLVPEMDQTKLGADLIPCADALMTRAKAARMKALFLTAYREMQQDPEFMAVGSVMGEAYADAFNLSFKAGHLFSYIPEHKPGQRLPVLLFLHGSAGNFKAYIWTWKRFADAHQVAIVAPSFGFGNWNKSGGMEAVDTAYNYCAHHPDLDAGQVILAGLSNGGLGVSRAACRNPGRYRGLIYISGVIEHTEMASEAFQQACRGKPVLVIHGAEDERIPRPYIEQSLSCLPGDMPVEKKFYPGEDHFLFFSKRTEVLQDVAKWMNGLAHGSTPLQVTERGKTN